MLMKNTYALAFTVLALNAITFSVCGQDENSSVSLSWKGYIQADERVHAEGAYDLSWQEYRLSLKSELKASGKARFFSDIWLRALGFSDPKHVSDLESFGKVSPQNLELREAYVDLYGLGCKDLDVTIGRQRIAWGTADRVNPTDNINPDDFEDIWDFGRHLGSDGAKAVYAPGKFTLTGVFIPGFKPAVLPAGERLNVFAPAVRVAQLPGFVFENMTDTVAMPELTLKESSTAALKIARRFFDFDLSLSYAYCRDDIPLPDSLLLLPVKGKKLDTLAAKAHEVYPRLHVAGLDCAGAVGKMGVWGEAAMFVPAKRTDLVTKFIGDVSSDPSLGVQQRAALLNLSQGVKDTTPSLDDAAYVKFVLGLDYAFACDVYVNAQFIHGFVHERGHGLENYVTADVDWSLFDNKLKISPLSMLLEIKSFSKFSDNYAIVVQPHVTWHPIDNADLALGLRLIDGKEGTCFATIKDEDEILVKVKYGF